MKRLFRSLRARLLLNNLLPLVVILPVVGFVLANLLHTQVILANIVSELTRQAVLVADFAATSSDVFKDTESAQDFLARISPNVPAKVMLLDAQGRLLVSSDPGDAVLIGTLYTVPDVSRLIAENTRAAVSYGEGKIEDIVVPVVSPSRVLIGYVRLANPLSEVYQRVQELRKWTLIVVLGGLAVGILLSLLLARELERPLQRTTRAAYQLASGERLDPLQEAGPQEVRVLVRAFNTLVDRLHTLEDARRRLLSNLVHELGTPLGALQSAVQALSSGAKDQPGLRDELLEGMSEELTLLKHLTEDLASLHGKELGSLDLLLEPLDPTEWLPPTLAPWGEAARQKKLSWQIDIADELPSIQADPERLSQALGNLLSNAIRYTPSGGQVRVNARQENGALSIEVQDNGPGIAAEELETIFEPFKRGKSAGRFPEGMGLGLSIARDLIRAHGGELRVSSAPGEGSRFVITIPAKEAQNQSI